MDSPLLPPKSNLNKELSLHLLFIFIISLLLLVPKIFFDLVLADRLITQDTAVRSITTAWSQEQVITPPILVFAAQSTQLATKNDDGSARYEVEQHRLLLLPHETHMQIKLIGQERQRGIYQATLYQAQVQMDGYFDMQELQMQLQDPAFMQVELSTLAPYFTVLLRDAAGIDEVTTLRVNGHDLTPRPGQNYQGAQLYDSFMAALDLNDATAKVPFSCSFKMRGSLSLALQALGGQVNLNVSGDNLSPSFNGRFLPSSHQVEANAFNATYTLSNLATGYTGLYLDALPDKSDLILDIQQGRQHYAFVERLSKYALFFIALTFVTVLAFELISGTMVSLVQYVVVGSALILFYMVLLSLSEHVSFLLAYSISALLMSMMIGLYMKAVFKSWRQGSVIFLILMALYVVLYAIVNAENYALLIGTALLVIMLGVVMFITRNLNQKRQG
ncbi:MAG: cell envelope integrity protein CreD [Candidatus Anaerobiospirillum merdipullorum]|uniref:Cell envelope integrity protein CreD n=1 Tax=Candidatus Anaerobiospirillum merdipullorum TaxID=2838450 RepID=A0A9E2KP72_9GAMM|nr:cell envelope integrity protein CreD [Candidatus Anaerobiospirillum merdipullorum]